jgi:hypothetical protein
MPTYHQVTVKGQQPQTQVGFQTNSLDSGGAPILKGAECTGSLVGVHGIANDQGLTPSKGNGVEGSGSNGGCGVLGQGPNLASPGPGVIGIGGDGLVAGAPQSQTFQGAPGVSGQGGSASAVTEPQDPPPAPAGPGVAGQGGDAATFLGGAQGNVPFGAPGAPGVTGTGGAAAFQPNIVPTVQPARGPAGPGVVGHGGTGIGDQAAGSGVIGVSGDTPIPQGIAGYGGVFTSNTHAQVHIVPAGNAQQAKTPPLPGNGQAGDLFVRVVAGDGRAVAELWFCSTPVPGQPQNAAILWNRVAFDVSTGPG